MTLCMSPDGLVWHIGIKYCEKGGSGLPFLLFLQSGFPCRNREGSHEAEDVI